MSERRYINSYGDVVGADWFLQHKDKIPAAWFERFVLVNQQEDVRHRLPQVTTTQFLGCPRQAALGRLEASPVIVSRLTNISVGLAMHKELSLAKVDRLVTEYVSPTVFEGEIEGIKVSGMLDGWIESDEGRVNLITPIDYKVRNPQARSFASEKNDWPQVSVYCHLINQTKGFDIEKARVYTCYLYNWEYQDYIPVPISTVLDSVPPAWNKQAPVFYTHRDLLRFADEGTRCNTVEEVLERIPAVGEYFYKNGMCGAYCQYDYVCHPEKLTGV